MVKAVIFDFDGVLAESVDIKTEAFRRLFEDRGEDVVNAVTAYHLEHGGVSRFEKFRHIYKEILRLPLSEEEFERLCRRFEKLVLEGVIAAPEVEGAAECLEKLKGRVRLFIVSGTPQEEMRAIVKARKLEHYFEAVLGSPETKPELLRKILKDCSLDPGNVVFVGDAMTDYMAAMETGTGFIARVRPESRNYWAGRSVRTLDSLSDLAGDLGL